MYNYPCHYCAKEEGCTWKALMKSVCHNADYYCHSPLLDLGQTPITAYIRCSNFEKKEDTKMKQKITVTFQFDLCKTCIHSCVCKHQPNINERATTIEYPFEENSPIKIKSELTIPVSCNSYRRSF